MARKLVSLLRHDEHVSRPCELVLALDLSFHSIAVGFSILCSQHWILVNLKASTVACIAIWRNCPCLFYMFTDMTLNCLDFGMLTARTAIFHWVFIPSTIVWNWLTCGFLWLVFLCMGICRKKTQIPNIIRTPKWPHALFLQGHVMASKLVPLLRHVIKTCDKHDSMRVSHVSLSLRWIFLSI